ncbi:MAG: zinc-ribbon and DUF3426 domain-containing protein [Gammaproteobacteria bacterium]|nr:zinc-ribbon and DUF3426 domain-containing protein [Gammaproteobacteria bacterium]
MIFSLCPSCHTVARVDAARLNAGELECGRCGQRYAPLGQLFDDVLSAQAAALARPRAPVAEEQQPVPVPEPETAPEAPPPPEAEATALQEPLAPLVAETAPALRHEVTGADWDAFGQPSLEGDVAGSVTSCQELDQEVRRQIEAALLQEMAEPSRRVSARTWLGLAAALLLVLALAGQWLYVQRDLWLDHPQWRPWADRACAVLGCELPLRRDSRQIELLEREVRDHPRVAEAVLISATFVNRATFPQPYPVFEVAFSDLSGSLLAMRHFAPAEYLEDPGAIPDGLAPGQPARVRLEVLDPGRQAVSFRMEFL